MLVVFRNLVPNVYHRIGTRFKGTFLLGNSAVALASDAASVLAVFLSTWLLSGVPSAPAATYHVHTHCYTSWQSIRLHIRSQWIDPLCSLLLRLRAPLFSRFFFSDVPFPIIYLNDIFKFDQIIENFPFLPFRAKMFLSGYKKIKHS